VLSGMPPANEMTPGAGRTTARVRPHDLGTPGEQARPVQARQRHRGHRRALGHAVGHERALPHVGAGPAGRHQLLVGGGHRRAIDAQLLRQLARGRELHAGREQPLADQTLDVGLDLPRQWQTALASRLAIESDLHDFTMPAILARFNGQ